MDYIRYYETMADYTADTTRLDPSLSYIAATGDAILEGNPPSDMVARAIGEDEFTGTVFGTINNYVTEITVPEGVTTISSSAFRDFVKLRKVSLPSTLTTISSAAFFGCSSLEEIEIPANVTSLSGAFNKSSALRKITIRATTPPTVNAATFNNTLPNKVIYVPAESVDAYRTAWAEYGYSSFITCEKEPYAPSATTSVVYTDDTVKTYQLSGNITFADLGESVYTAADIKELRIGTDVTGIGVSAFEGASSLTFLGLPDTVTAIGDRAFYGTSALKEVYFPSGLVSIGQRSFQNSGVIYVEYTGDSLRTIDNYAFSGASLTIGYVPEGVTDIGKSVFGTSSAPSLFDFPSTLSSMGYALKSGTASAKLTIRAAQPPHLNNGIGVESTANITFGSGVLQIYVPADSLTEYTNNTHFAVTGVTISAIP